MAATDGGDQINIEADVHRDVHDGGNNTTGNDDGTTGTAQANTGGASGSTGTTNFNLSIEQNKILEFFGTKSKDTISAADFILRLEDLAKTNLLPLRQLTPESSPRMAIFSGRLGRCQT
jgi:hypothetical protein